MPMSDEEFEEFEAHQERQWEAEREDALVRAILAPLRSLAPVDLGNLRSLARLAADVLALEPTPEPVCLTCLGRGEELVPVGRPDRFGNQDTDEVRCSTCEGAG